MSSIQQPAAPRALSFGIAITLMSLSLTAQGCSPPGDPVDNVQNDAAPIPLGNGATADVTTLDNRAGSQIAEKHP